MLAIRKIHTKWADRPLESCDNLGLKIDKLNHEIDKGGKEHEHKDKMLSYLKNFKVQDSLRQSYTHAFKRWQAIMEKQKNTLCFTIESESKVLLGTGNPSVHEFGVNLNKPWGVPYISGSGLKGLVSSYLAQNGGEQWHKDDKIQFKSAYQLELFGGTKKSDEKREEKEKSKSFIGSVMFYDAWLLPKHSSDWFCEDIINVHYQGYYKQERLPDGTEEPIPIKIAALNPGLCFFLVLQGRRQYLNFVKEVLTAALAGNGIGGKTSVGYGRFIVQKTQKELEEEIRKKIKDTDTEELADTEELLKLYNSHKNDSRFAGDFFKILDRIKAETSLEPLYLKFHPLKYVAYAIENGRADTEKAFRKIAKQIKDNLKNFEKQHPELKLSKIREAGIILQHVRDKLHMTGEEIEQNSLLKQLTCTWEDIKIDENNIDQILAEPGKSSWPPVSGLKKAIRNSSLPEEDKEIALMEVEDYLKNKGDILFNREEI